jgi:hypothetical protein
VNLPPPATPSGDYNGNGTVDAADYVVWRKTLNQSVSPAGSGADGNASGTIDADDYNFWRTRFGTVVSGSSIGSGAGVPEPTTAAILLGALSIVRMRLKRTYQR